MLSPVVKSFAGYLAAAAAKAAIAAGFISSAEKAASSCVLVSVMMVPELDR